MKNYFSPETEQKEQQKTRWADDIIETMNQAYKRQLEMTTEFYNRMLGTSFTKGKTTTDGSPSRMKIWENNLNRIEQYMNIYSDWFRQMPGFAANPFYDEKNWKTFYEKITEDAIANYERQIQWIKEFNNNSIDTLENNSHGTGLETHRVIRNFRKNTEDSLDLYMNTVKALLKPGNKELLTEINDQIDSITKLNFEIWTDLLASMTSNFRENISETWAAGEKTTEKESAKAAKQQYPKNEGRESKTQKESVSATREKELLETTKK